MTPTRPAAPPVLVLYDDGCAFCIWAVGLFLRLDRRRILTTAPIQHARSTVLRDVPDDRVLQSWHVVTDGRVVSGGDALALVAGQIPFLAPFGTVLRRRPGFSARLYAAVASRRARLARVVPEGWKQRARSTVAARSAPGESIGLA